MAILFSVCGLFGCEKAQKPAKHELSEITAVSISCGNMDRSCGYSFCAHKEESTWLLDAECFTHDHEAETVLKNHELSCDDVEALLEILKQSESIAYAENYKKSKIFVFQVADKETYGFCLIFSDGSRYETSDKQSNLEKIFYNLAEKYSI